MIFKTLAFVVNERDRFGKIETGITVIAGSLHLDDLLGCEIHPERRFRTQCVGDVVPALTPAILLIPYAVL